MTPDRTLKFVRLDDVEAHEALGWINLGSLYGCHHGRWAELMEYRGPDREHPLGPPDDRQD